MGLGFNMIAWMESIYRHLTAWIKMNNLSSDPLVLSRGVRQGCPLFPLLIDIYMEAFALAIRQDEHIKGLTCNGQQIKLVQYADDTVFFLLEPKSSLQALMDRLNFYSKILGSRINF